MIKRHKNSKIFSSSFKTAGSLTLRKKIFNILLISFTVTIASYGIFAGKTVYNAIQLSNNAKEMSKLGSAVSNLESEYMAQKSKITLNLARSKGFEEVPVSKYITGTSLGKALTSNSNI
ncbi:MAG: hypothetical protein WCT19_04340 [Candidatus Paceibacterota bacterium]|jgi:hypothetical protein